MSGTASRALSGSGGSLIGRLKEGGMQEAENDAKESGGLQRRGGEGQGQAFGWKRRGRVRLG